MDKLVGLFSILNNLSDYEVDDVLYLSKDEVWSTNTTGAVLDPDEAEDPEGDHYEFKKDNNLKYILSISTILEIKDNAVQQIGSLDTEKLISAMFFYYKNDAFKVF